MKESDKKKIGEAYLRLHSDDKKKPMTPEEAIKELREASDSEVRYGDTEHHYDEVMKRVEALDLAIKALETQERLTKMLYKQITAYAEMKKSKHFSDLEYGRMTAYAHCLEVLNDDE